jgi:predicted Zn-dependent protease
MPRCFPQFLIVLSLLVSGCANRRQVTSTTTSSTKLQSAAATQPVDPKSYLTLDQIQPAPTLAAPATEPTTRPSLDALVLFARARDAMNQGQRYTAITHLEKAISLDPNGYDLRYELGKAYMTISSVDDRALDAFEHAAAIDPNHLDLQVQLGRIYLAKGQLARGIEHLRLALATKQYASGDDEGSATVADFFLARALKEAGYDRAALDEYEATLKRLSNPTLQIRQDQELGYLINRPDLLYVQMGELYERHSAYDQALQAYQAAADHDPKNADLQARLARVLASLGRRDEALGKTASLIFSSSASQDSLTLLRDVCNRLNLPGGEIAALEKLHQDQPKDRAVLSALVDLLVTNHRNSEAEQLLTTAWKGSPGDVQLTRRLVGLLRQRDAVDEAARVLVISLAQNPDALRNLTPMWNELLRPSQRNRLRIETIQKMHFSPDEEAAKQFWISRIADLFHRDALAKSALEQSIKATPPFAPAYRSLLAQTWVQDELSTEQKLAASQRLADTAAAGGNAALATEIQGLTLLNQKKTVEAGNVLGKAIEQGGKSPDLLLAQAVAARAPGKDAQFEQSLWRLISDYPLYEDGYALLFRYYADPDVGSLNQAMKVLSTWLGSDPQSMSARLVQASVDAQLGQERDAETQLQRLFVEDPDNPEVLEGLRAYYARAGRLDQFTTQLEDYRGKHPQDTDVVAKLASIYADQKRMAEATRVLDATRAAVADDPDLLYNVAQLYAHFEQKQTTEDVLQQVVKLDPNHASASNDLGYTWADEGKNLAGAESLIRVAVAAEPDNESFLDSLGWVLYKRGKFAEARQYLEQAVGPAAFPDPVVLDHLADTMYRLQQTAEATKLWQRSLKGIGDGEVDRDDLKQLRLQLIQKIKDAEANKPVEVAPTVESAAATGTAQAKQ